MSGAVKIGLCAVAIMVAAVAYALLFRVAPGFGFVPFLLLLWPAKPLPSLDDELKKLLTEGVK